jgi:hypothetical protein
MLISDCPVYSIEKYSYQDGYSIVFFNMTYGTIKSFSCIGDFVFPVDRDVIRGVYSPPSNIHKEVLKL